MSRKALVLGGGGPVGIAWESGVIAGMAEAGIDLTHADFIVGTSAGSVVGAQIAMGRTPAALVEPFTGNGESAPPPARPCRHRPIFRCWCRSLWSPMPDRVRQRTCAGR